MTEQGPLQQPPPALTAGTPTNPWLIALGVIGLIALPLGVALYIAGLTATGNPFLNEPDTDPVMMAWGLIFASIGVATTVAWLAASAVCWQTQNR
jgi:hypothetical protein